MLVPVIKFASLLFWSCALVLALVRVHTVARTRRSEHIGHFLVRLTGLVPLSCAMVGLVLLRRVVNLPSIVGFLFMFLRAGFVIALHLELRRIVRPQPDRDRLQALLGLGLAAVVLTGRGRV